MLPRADARWVSLPVPRLMTDEAKGLLLTSCQTMVTRQIEHYCDWEYIHDPVRKSLLLIHFDQGVSLTPCPGSLT